ncbi:hypothetical protein ASPSYDRAFT_87914 [Aspergillus sydowii CBS 593.65]|uniref:F-box domain-containing protein n=1 Tax=Aspergillus sydowii CBS 593.65 TaxID=1036612 RepID=A0A1L9TPP4_9EURO|nr:uncharacterized protein ASPSYDRAFT_87914 [Aspergillus sydowii CBS 593.65]OJJ61365.1 hypothetical protein ASPSYDRAFT_87914 [Aspergillus sydowii CBS 593.65]
MIELTGLIPSPNFGATIFKKLLGLLRRPSRTKPSLTALPNRLLIEIFQYLPLLDQASLALTCKSFHFIFNHVFENELFRFPRLYQLRLPNLYPNGIIKLGRTRQQFLRRIQDKRVRYCAKCMKLHRRETFAQPTYNGPMIYREFCWTEAGVVDLCPCVSLTIHDKDRIVCHLRRMAKGKSVVLKDGLERFFVLGSCRGVVTTNGSLVSGRAPTHAPALVHCCAVSGHAFVEARVRTVLYIGRKDVLVAETEYEVSADARVMEWWSDDDGFADAHYNLLWAMRTSEMGLLLDGQGEQRGGPKAMRQVSFSVKRNLGSCELPADGYWSKQDRLMSPSYVRLMHAYGS